MKNSFRFVSVILVLIAALVSVVPASAGNVWAVGNLVGLCAGTHIYHGPGGGYSYHTIVPENNWTVKVIDGPRYFNGEAWWDTSRKAAGDPSGGTGWVKQSEADNCPSSGGGGGGGDTGGGGGGSGGGGGGGTLPVPCSLPIDFLGVDLPRVAAVMPYVETIYASIEQEYSFDSYLSRCPALVSYDVTGNQLRIHSDNGELTLNNFMEPQGISLSVNKTFVGYDPGLIGFDPTFGIKNEYSAEIPDRFSLEGEHELKWIFRFRKPNFNYNPAYTELYYKIAVAGAIAAFIAGLIVIAGSSTITVPATALAVFVLAIGGWYQQTTGSPLGSPVQSYHSKPYVFNNGTIPIAQIQSPRYRLVAEPPSNEVVQALKDSYGPLVDFADVGVLVPGRQVISAYTIFSFEGSGFTPNSDVYVTFGPYGSPQPVREGFFHTDNLGHLKGEFEMPAPDQTPLGNYILAAVDAASVDASLDQLVAGQSTSLSLYMAGAKIEVVEDVTPPTITIISPIAKSYNRCDQPYIDFSVVDDLSGVAEVNAWLDDVKVRDGDRIDMLFWNLGGHVLDVQAFDKVGWEQNQSTEFQLGATIKGTQCALDRFQKLKLFKINGTYASIRAHLSSADRALQRGKLSVARNDLKSILKILEAQKKKIDPKAYKILLMDVQALQSKPVR